jgi:hypothetical protein
MPQQVNIGVTAYMLKGCRFAPRRDVQWIEWKPTAARPYFEGQPRFRNVFNYSLGVEYRVDATEEVTVLTRLGYRRFNAPWDDPDNLPMVGRYKLLVNTKAASFNIVTFRRRVHLDLEGGKGPDHRCRR